MGARVGKSVNAVAGKSGPGVLATVQGKVQNGSSRRADGIYANLYGRY